MTSSIYREWSMRYVLVGILLTSSLIHFGIFYAFKSSTKPQFSRNSSNTENPIWDRTQTNTSEDITIVTAYFSIGGFKKGNKGFRRGEEEYIQWLRSFQRLLNPVVFFTDSKRFALDIKEKRQQMLHTTKIVHFSRTKSWAFSLLDQVGTVFNQTGYPAFHPNTVVPEYACAQFAKYDVIEIAVKKNYFRTKHYAWLDIGYFREFSESIRPHRLSIPNEFNESTVAVTRVNMQPMMTSMGRIVGNNLVWVGGGLILGKNETLLSFVNEFRGAVGYFLWRKLISTDQQILYGLYSKEGRAYVKPRIELQLFYSDRAGDWFHLGKRMLEVECHIGSGTFCKMQCSECDYSYTYN